MAQYIEVIGQASVSEEAVEQRVALTVSHRGKGGGMSDKVVAHKATQQRERAAELFDARQGAGCDIEVHLETVAGAQHDLTGDSVACEQGIGELVTPRRAEPFEFGEVVRAMARGQAHQHRASIDRHRRMRVIHQRFASFR